MSDLSSDSCRPPAVVGYLTVIEDAEHGFFGGYLVLNAALRPLEFHCTAPVQPTRAQEILYGPTLREYVFGEQIGGALLAKARAKADLVLVETEEALAAQRESDAPLAWLRKEESPGERRMITASPHRPERAAVAEAFVTQHPGLDLMEPFERIRLAIAEARRAAA